MATESSAPLEPEEAARLTEFARACKAAARAVMLYPAGHPAVLASLGRIVQITAATSLSGALRITVLPDGLQLGGRVPVRVDAAIVELAELLHSQLIGQLTIHPGGDVDAWRNFLLLLGGPPESIRAEGGIARVWAMMAGRHVELREIDYAEVLRERAGGEGAVWKQVIANCLHGDAFDLDETAIRELLGIAADSEQLASLMSAIEKQAGVEGGDVAAKTAALMRMLSGILEAVSKADPGQLEPVLNNMASAVGQLSPEMLISLVSQRGEGPGGPAAIDAVVSRMTEATIARFVARNVMSDGTSTDRLAEAFQTLVKGGEDRERLLTLAHDDLAASMLGGTEDFESVWGHVSQKLLTSYSDTPYVSQQYARELSGARARAIEVEEVSDDPPERIGAWIRTIEMNELRALDLTLLLDLLRIEQEDQRWGELMRPVITKLEDLLLAGDFDAAEQLVAALVREGLAGSTPGRRQLAITAMDVLVAGPMMRHIVSHLTTIDDARFERVKNMCVSVGEVLVRPLAEALSVEERERPRERLTAILIAFGAIGRRTVERLKTSHNAAVRRTAIYLLRQFGGSDALPDLTELLDDTEPQVQREAIRAILSIGTDRAYEILQQALAGGTARSRDAIMQSISLMREERAGPLFTYILRHVDHRGRLAGVYLRAIESLGALRDPEGVPPLKEALYKGEWWAPRRTTALRVAAASALARIGTPDAKRALEEAMKNGSRGVRAVVRAQVQAAQGRARGARTGDA